MHQVDYAFLEQFPDGLNDVAWISLCKKHQNNLDKQLKEYYNKDNFKKLLKQKKYDEICEISLKFVRRASVISVFEKVALANYMTHTEIHKDFSIALFDFLHDFNKENFEKFALILARFRSEKNCNVAKWTVLSFFIAFFDRNKYVFVKPTTTKKIANALNTDICYNSYPTYETYMNVYNMIYDFKNKSDICKDLDIMLTEAVLYCVVSFNDNVMPIK